MKHTTHFCDTSMDLGGAIDPADAHGFDLPRVQNCLLEFSVKAHP